MHIYGTVFGYIPHYAKMVHIGSLVAFALPLLITAFPLTKRSINGPLINENFPDPSFIEVDGQYYAFGTSSGDGLITHATSPDFTTWTVQSGGALTSAGSWASGHDVWAPSVYAVGGQYVMYYSAQLSDGSTHCVGVAISSTPGGPYSPQGSAPVACPSSQGGAIDAFGYIDADGTNYLIYKIDGNSIGHGGNCGNSVDPIVPTPIMAQRMSADGLSTDGSAPVQLLDRGDADGPLTEAPAIMRVADSSSAGGNLYFLFFSSNCYSSSLYDVSYAYSTSGIEGPYTKSSAPLLLTGNPYSQLYAPGGLSTGLDGTSVIFMADQEQSSGTRVVYTGQLSIDVAGRTVSL